ncbi:MAG: hypothetical protein WCP93_00835 [Candidatus Berkelbacteria bacterium]
MRVIVVSTLLAGLLLIPGTSYAQAVDGTYFSSQIPIPADPVPGTPPVNYACNLNEIRESRRKKKKRQNRHPRNQGFWDYDPFRPNFYRTGVRNH